MYHEWPDHFSNYITEFSALNMIYLLIVIIHLVTCLFRTAKFATDGHKSYFICH